jgi:hypothetical protein
VSSMLREDFQGVKLPSLASMCRIQPSSYIVAQAPVSARGRARALHCASSRVCDDLHLVAGVRQGCPYLDGSLRWLQMRRVDVQPQDFRRLGRHEGPMLFPPEARVTYVESTRTPSVCTRQLTVRPTNTHQVLAAPLTCLTAAVQCIAGNRKPHALNSHETRGL